ncbi:MAG: DUF4118 domain-containing protein [Lachnospiraceae bacterium]|nr:DUF4118 domain-containing protein [Lachnospiraceae bacterium]
MSENRYTLFNRPPVKLTMNRFSLLRFLENLMRATGIFMSAIVICSIFKGMDGIEGYASPVFVLTILLISRFTDGFIYGVIAAFAGVICVNFLFTYPYMAVNFTISGYPLTFLVLLIVSLITSTLTSQAKQRDYLKLENEKERIRSDLLRALSHDIRTPLTSISGAASTLLDNPDISPEESYSLLTDIHQEAMWLIRMVENLLSITKLDNSSILETEQWAVDEVIAEAVGKIQKNYPEFPIEVSVPQMPLFIQMDPLLIEQVLLNLSENSIIHAENVTTVWIRVQKQEDCALFCICDDGGGFPPEVLEDIQKGTIRTKITEDREGKRNMGLGIRVCSTVIRAHGGKLSARNGPDGAEVYFTLPLEHVPVRNSGMTRI